MDLGSGLSSLLEQLNRIREENGEEAYQQARRAFAKEFVKQGPKGSEFIRKLFPDLAYETIDAEVVAEQQAPLPPKASPADMGTSDRLFIEAMRLSMPGLRTQAQFDAFMAAFDALRSTANGIFEGDAQAITDGKEALSKALDTLGKVTEVSEKLREVPEAATSKASEAFKKPPAQFEEQPVQTELLAELGQLRDLAELTEWYQRRRPDIDRVVTPAARNVLFDAIRERKSALA